MLARSHGTPVRITRVEVPQPPGLCLGQPEAWHLLIFALHPLSSNTIVPIAPAVPWEQP